MPTGFKISGGRDQCPKPCATPPIWKTAGFILSTLRTTNTGLAGIIFILCGYYMPEKYAVCVTICDYEWKSVNHRIVVLQL